VREVLDVTHDLIVEDHRDIEPREGLGDDVLVLLDGRRRDFRRGIRELVEGGNRHLLGGLGIDVVVGCRRGLDLGLDRWSLGESLFHRRRRHAGRRARAGLGGDSGRRRHKGLRDMGATGEKYDTKEECNQRPWLHVVSASPDIPVRKVPLTRGKA
jgi:hypothetical protein